MNLHSHDQVSATGSDRRRSTARAGELRQERSRLIDRLEQIITQDIGGRGLAVDPKDNLVTRCQGHLAGAAQHLARDGTAVAIATGFYVAHAPSPTIETDGPCGAIALAWILANLGMPVTLVTDPVGEPVLSCGMQAASFGTLPISLAIFPFENDDPSSPGRRSNELRFSRRSHAWVETLFRAGIGGQLSHLVSVERAGPSHFGDEREILDLDEPAGNGESTILKSAEGDRGHTDQVHNFRGQVITTHTGKIHMLFDFVRSNSLPVCTIGIGDGGNEIGMGSIPAAVIAANIPGGLGARIACRIATDWTIACGVSNWGAYALGTAVAKLRNRPDLLAEWTDEREQRVLEALVRAGAVDGVTARPSQSVDGLPIDEHLAIWRQIREATKILTD